MLDSQLHFSEDLGTHFYANFWLDTTGHKQIVTIIGTKICK